MKNKVIILIFLLFTQTTFAMGFGDWSYVTSNGSQLYDPGDAVYLSKNHIIGEYRLNINDDEAAYFILNEMNGKLKTYNNKQLYDIDLRTQEHVPLFWTRWYTNHFTLIQAMYILWLFYSLILTCFILLIVLLIFMSIVLKNKIIKIIFIVITLFLLIPPTLFMLNGYFTNSI